MPLLPLNAGLPPASPTDASALTLKAGAFTLDELFNADGTPAIVAFDQANLVDNANGFVAQATLFQAALNGVATGLGDFFVELATVVAQGQLPAFAGKFPVVNA